MSVVAGPGFKGSSQPNPQTMLNGDGDSPTLPDMERVVRLETIVERIEKDLVDLKADGKNTRTTVIVTALALAGLVVAIWQAQLSQMANMLSAFQSGLSAVQAGGASAVQNFPPTVIQVQPAPVTVMPPSPASPTQR
jgi:hypothetical protein